tara:strand:+ start:155 stop:556 length:402 start_codon:yes stop_codon:yes gene_type:complete
MFEQSKDIREHIKSALTHDYNTKESLENLVQKYGDAHSGLHQELFNMDYYIIGYFNAEQWLKGSTFDAMALIKDYEESNFGELTTDISCPEKVANMTAYILGEQCIYDEFYNEINDILEGEEDSEEDSEEGAA